MLKRLLFLFMFTALPAHANTLEKKPVLQPIASQKEELFQTLILSKALKQLGFEVKPVRYVPYNQLHEAVAKEFGAFSGVHWTPTHNHFFNNAGGDRTIWRGNPFITGAMQGYLIDKKTANEYRITHVHQLKNPAIAKLFDNNNDGKADLIGCPKGWGCELDIEHHLDAYHLRNSVNVHKNDYQASMSKVIELVRAGKPVFYYTWTPHWISDILRPNKDVVWLQVPFTALPNASEEQVSISMKLPARNYGFLINMQKIIANHQLISRYPEISRLFSQIRLSVHDVNKQNRIMYLEKHQISDIDQYTDAWINKHHRQFNNWVKNAQRFAERHHAISQSPLELEEKK